MTEIHAFDPDGTPSPGAAAALDPITTRIANLEANGGGGGIDGGGITALWTGTAEQYQALTPVPTTLYIVTGGTIPGPDPDPDPNPGDPGAVQALGVPTTTQLATSAAASITPALPTLPTGWWGYITIVASNTTTTAAWAAPPGWTVLADNPVWSNQWATRAVAVFAAPASTSPAAFAAPGAVTARYVAITYPVKAEPTVTGSSYRSNNTAPYSHASTQSVTFSAKSVPLVFVTTNYSTFSGVPSMPDADTNAGSGPGVFSPPGSVTGLHSIVGATGFSHVATNYPLGEPMSSGVPAYVLGIGGT